MRVAVYGAGAVGAYYGSRLSDGGAEVHLIARGRHLAAIRERGLTVITPEATTVTSFHATDEPAEIGPVDVVLLCVKSYDTDAVAGRLPSLLHADTAVISLQNGIDNEDRIAVAIGANHVVGGAAYILAAIAEPGVVTASGPRRIVIGELSGGQPSPRIGTFLDVAHRGGIDADAVADVRVAKWEKYVLLVAFSAMTAAIRLPIGDIRRSGAAVEMLRAIVTEAWAVGRATGVELDEGLIESRMTRLLTLEDDATTSLYHDLTTGHRMELEALQGALIRLGRSTGVPTPHAEAAYAILEPWAIRNDR
ncbi:MAG TPA: 2-dehydropantoate 2-reductase [Candidatus Limnocylindrales bacterium]|nr:2-dehydropantoate 2-reductase [Candidatus Limnocylindrales bacterium]